MSGCTLRHNGHSGFRFSHPTRQSEWKRCARQGWDTTPTRSRPRQILQKKSSGISAGTLREGIGRGSCSSSSSEEKSSPNALSPSSSMDSKALKKYTRAGSSARRLCAGAIGSKLTLRGSCNRIPIAETSKISLIDIMWCLAASLINVLVVKKLILSKCKLLLREDFYVFT